MKAWRNVGGVVNSIDVDVGLDNQPILPPDTTTDARPEAIEGHYTTVVGNSWVQIPIPVAVESFESKKTKALNAVSSYRAWYLEQPVEINGVVFDADEYARGRLTQALVIYVNMGYLPPFWITKDNAQFPLADVDALKGIVGPVHTAFSTRFYECDAIRQQILAAADEAALALIDVPKIPSAV